MKAATLMFFAIATYMLGAIAQAVATPYEALALGQPVSWQFQLIAPAQLFGAGVFAVLALGQAFANAGAKPPESSVAEQVAGAHEGEPEDHHDD